jgi:hypothetical protein
MKQIILLNTSILLCVENTIFKLFVMLFLPFSYSKVIITDSVVI